MLETGRKIEILVHAICDNGKSRSHGKFWIHTAKRKISRVLEHKFSYFTGKIEFQNV